MTAESDLAWLTDICTAMRKIARNAGDTIQGYLTCCYDEDGRMLHIEAHVVSTEPEATEAEARCLETACRFLELASGHRTFIRRKPEVKVDRYFETRTRLVHAYVRFSTSPDEGPWVTMSPWYSQMVYVSYGQ